MIRTFIESDSANLSSTVSNKPDARDTKNPTHLLWRGVVIRSWRIENAKGDEKRGGERRASKNFVRTRLNIRLECLYKFSELRVTDSEIEDD